MGAIQALKPPYDRVLDEDGVFVGASRQALYEVISAWEHALDIALQYGGMDGEHHKAWVIDQMVRALTGDDYLRWVTASKCGPDGSETYTWDEGIPP